MLNPPSVQRMLANTPLRSFRKSFIWPPKKTEKRALAVNFLTPGGSVVLRKHDRHLQKAVTEPFAYCWPMQLS